MKFILRVAGKAHRKLQKLRNVRNLRQLPNLQKFAIPLTKSGNLFKGLQGRPMESYENYEIYENCEIYDNSPYHYENCEIYNNSPYYLQTQRNVLKVLV